MQILKHTREEKLVDVDKHAHGLLKLMEFILKETIENRQYLYLNGIKLKLISVSKLNKSAEKLHSKYI